MGCGCKASFPPVTLRHAPPLRVMRSGASPRLIRWCGVVWIGFPYPLRLLFEIVHPQHPPVDSWDGCGCIKALKDRWSKFRSKRDE